MKFTAALGAMMLAASVMDSARMAANLPEPEKQIAAGRELFTRVWTAGQGLGPTINARSCTGCHNTPQIGGSGADTRAFVLLDQNILDPTGGHVFRRLRVERSGAFTERASPATGVLRRSPSLLGSGLVEQIAQAAIGENADPDDADHDGISGRVPDGRFGWKGRFPTLRSAVAAGFINELGISSPIFPSDGAPSHSAPAVELTDPQLNAVVAFVSSRMAVSPGRLSAFGEYGRSVFEQIGCRVCHKPSLRLASGSQIHPYSDLLLHDVGLALADGIADGRAGGTEFKTAPLWGISHIGPPYLHDGRAKTLSDAIAGHAGEGARAASEYQKLSLDDRGALLAFLGSL